MQILFQQYPLEITIMIVGSSISFIIIIVSFLFLCKGGELQDNTSTSAGLSPQEFFKK